MPLSLYPQAFLCDYGHVQAKGVIDVLKVAVNDLNSSLRKKDHTDGDSSDTLDEEAPINVDPAVVGVSSQMYNAVQHRVSTNAGNLDVQQGRISAALAGSHATTPKNKRSAQHHLWYCKKNLLHSRFKDRIRHNDCPTSLRVENVYGIDLTQMSQRDRTGESIYSIICCLVDALRQSDVVDRIKPHLIVFRPGVCFVLLGENRESDRSDSRRQQHFDTPY